MASTREYGAKLLEALGIETSRVFKAVITIEVNDVIRVEVSRWAEAPGSRAIESIQESYFVSATKRKEPEAADHQIVDVTTLSSTERKFHIGPKP